MQYTTAKVIYTPGLQVADCTREFNRDSGEKIEREERYVYPREILYPINGEQDEREW